MVKRGTKSIATKIVNYLNEINFNEFTKEELKEGFTETMYNLENDKSTLLNQLKVEYKENPTQELKEIIEEVLKYE